MENKPREIVVHQSCNRPNLLLGGDRELVLLSAILSAMLAFVIATWWGAVSGIVLWAFAVAVLNRLGKADPLMRQVYIRHIHYKPFYPAKSPVSGVPARTPLSWPR
jgi:type IV secretion system protein VirB3